MNVIGQQYPSPCRKPICQHGRPRSKTDANMNDQHQEKSREPPITSIDDLEAQPVVQPASQQQLQEEPVMSRSRLLLVVGATVLLVVSVVAILLWRDRWFPDQKPEHLEPTEPYAPVQPEDEPFQPPPPPPVQPPYSTMPSFDQEQLAHTVRNAVSKLGMWQHELGHLQHRFGHLQHELGHMHHDFMRRTEPLREHFMRHRTAIIIGVAVLGFVVVAAVVAYFVVRQRRAEEEKKRLLREAEEEEERRRVEAEAKKREEEERKKKQVPFGKEIPKFSWRP